MDKISAFMDGESVPTEAYQTLNRLRQDPASRELWDRFHMVGDVMRGDPLLRDDFVQRLRQRMDAEPAVLAPRLSWRRTANVAMSAAAAIAGVTVVLILVLTENPLRPQGEVASATRAPVARLAQTPDAEVRPQPLTSVNSTQVNEYLMAHQEFSPCTALQGSRTLRTLGVVRT